MSEPIAAYQGALKDLARRRERLTQVAELIYDVGRKLRDHYERVVVADARVAGEPPGPGAPRDRVTIEARDWPDARRLADDLRAYQEAATEVRAAYARIPAEVREVIHEPPAR